MDYEDVTEQFTDLNAEDRIVRAANGTLIKIKTLHDPESSRFGQLVFRMSGAIVGPDGKALSPKHVHEEGHTFMWSSDDPEANMAEGHEREIATIVRRTLQAHRRMLEHPTIKGIGSLQDFKARNPNAPAPMPASSPSNAMRNITP
jgi:hypothetical protein